MSNSWVSEARAGLVVFLIALPLSLGIALASGAPSTAGLIAAIMGGLVGAFLGGSHVTINGPAAGLIVVVLAAIQNLSFGDPVMGFKRFLACVVVVGVLQIISGLLKAGRFVALFPSSVVHGMLTSIGLIIMIKQFHVLLGQKAQGSIFNSIIQIPASLMSANTHAEIISIIALAVLLAYPYIKHKIAKIVPAPLVVAIIAIALGSLWADLSKVQIPSDMKAFIITPSFDMITSMQSLMAIFSLFFVASLESLLSASAVDKLDPLKRESDFDRELWSKGVVNLCCGLIGGLPIIAEIVRSSANISQGAKTPKANFLHSAFMLAFVVLFPSVLNMIPLPALAAILVLVGYRLANPAQFKEMKNMGTSSFLAFLATILFTLAEDLLVGILMGVIVKIMVSYFKGAKLKLQPSYKLRQNGDEAFLEFEHSLSFFSALHQRKILRDLATFKTIEINMNALSFIDPTSAAIVKKEIEALEKNGRKVKYHVPEKFSHMFGKSSH